jgi:hypothetical protein
MDFTPWKNIEFEFYISDKAMLDNTGIIGDARDLRLSLSSGGDIDTDICIYSFTAAVTDAGFEQGDGKWQKITIPFDSFIFRQPNFNMDVITGMRISLYLHGVTAGQMGIRNITLTGSQQ